MDSRTENAEPSDPDYESLRVDKLGEINESLHREDARDQTVQKIEKIIHEQFSFEIELKEKEVTSINRRVHETRSLLDRLRACILAGYYGHGGILRQEDVRKRRTRSGKPRSNETCLSDVMRWKQSLPSNLKEHAVEAETLSHMPEGDLGMLGVNDGHPETPEGTSLDNCGPSGHLSSAFQPKAPSNLSAPEARNHPETIQTSISATETESRFYVKRRVIVGNTSKFILPEHRESNDRSTHKWMVYVRGPKDNMELQNFVSKVWFLLHPSYQPNDLVEVSRPPFQVTRRGWGEFPVRVQLHFVENKNKRVDIIHHLKLDKTYTGLQTLGAETHVDIELDRKNFDCQSSQSVNHLQPADSIGQTSKTSVPQTSTTTPENCKSSNFDLLQELNHELTDHSYSVPLTKQQKPPSDDGMKYPTPPVSVPGSRCSTPELSKESLFSTLAYQSEVSLRKSVQQFPLVDPDHDVAISPYCAKTLDQYLRWNIGKRLAAEWHRSLAIRNHLRSNNPSSALSTKEVMNYCRIHGYTPMAIISADEKSLCKTCGEEKSLDEDVEMPMGSFDHEHCDEESETPGTLSNADDFLNLVEMAMSPLTEPEAQTDCELELVDIDVVGITDGQSKKHSQDSKLLFLPITEELEWVQETATEVDIHLQGINLDGVRAPVTAAMLYKACGLLVQDILRKANRFTWRTPSTIPKTNCILPTHIRKAVEVVPHCDFLTNKYLGVVAPSVKD